MSEKQSNVCANCGKPFKKGDKYCRHCGAPMGTPEFIIENTPIIYGPPRPSRRFRRKKG